MPEPWGLSDVPRDSTPLDPDEAAGLRLSWVATRADLDEAEQANIVRGLARPRWSRASTSQLLDDLAVRALHTDLFGEVWSWAGTYRRTERSIGIDPTQISTRVRDLLADAAFWLVEPDLDAAACQFHHRLVQIHPFANGNGRHARVLTDLLLASRGAAPFSWGSTELVTASQTRTAYIAALRGGDGGDLSLLRSFVRT